MDSTSATSTATSIAAPGSITSAPASVPWGWIALIAAGVLVFFIWRKK